MSVCAGCGKRILWGVKADGGKVPLDPAAPVYAIVKIKDTSEIVRTDLAMVSHFATCPNANEFSGSRKRNANPNTNY